MGGVRSIALVTDSASSLPAECLQALEAAGGFALIDLPVRVADQPLAALPGRQVDEAIAMAHVQGQQVSTSGAAPGALADLYQGLADQGFSAVLSVHMSAALSGTYDAARLAAGMVSIPVAVVDSQTLALALGEVLLQLHRILESLEDLTEAADLARRLSSAADLFFFIPTLDALKRGGRVHPALAMVGQMFQIRPVASIAEGRLTYLERPRTTGRAIERLRDITLQTAAAHRAAGWGAWGLEGLMDSAPAGQVVAVQYSGNLEQALDFKASLGPAAAGARVCPLPPVLSAHAGLGALATVVL